MLTLVTEGGLVRGTGESLSAFGSPNIVHVSVALLISAVCSAPWHGPATPGVAVLEDWIRHPALPITAYTGLVWAGFQLARAADDAAFVVAGVALLLVFVGIHNAWDTVMYVTVERARARKAKSAAPEAAARPARQAP